MSYFEGYKVRSERYGRWKLIQNWRQVTLTHRERTHLEMDRLPSPLMSTDRIWPFPLESVLSIYVALGELFKQSTGPALALQ